MKSTNILLVSLVVIHLQYALEVSSDNHKSVYCTEVNVLTLSKTVDDLTSGMNSHVSRVDRCPESL